MGCSNRIVKWFESYLSERRERFVINGQSSDWVHILAGVPQGSILGPLLFLIYFNETVKDIGCPSACLLMIQVCISLWTVPFNQPNF